MEEKGTEEIGWKPERRVCKDQKGEKRRWPQREMNDEDVSDKEELSDLKSNEEKDGGREQARGLHNLKSFISPFSAAFFKRMSYVFYGA